MTDAQWNRLLEIVGGGSSGPPPAPAAASIALETGTSTSPPQSVPPIGFIIDSPWLPNWYGIDILDYFSSEDLWFEANRKAIETFPEVMFLPGFWSEFGMCTEPSAFGSKSVFYQNEFPFAEKVILDVAQVEGLAEPNPSTDGLLPFMLHRLKRTRPRIEAMGHKIRFSVSRGPLNVATFLMGTTEFLMAIKTDPEPMHKLLALITRFLKKWHELQRQTFPTIQGIFVLDDIVGFLGEGDFKEFGLPYLKDLFAVDLPVKFFHNDAECAKSLPYYADLGINLYNPGIFNTLEELRSLSGNRLALLGNIPPRDVLAKGSPEDVRAAVKRLLAGTSDKSRLVLSCAGGMPPGVKTENIRAFIDAAQAG